MSATSKKFKKSAPQPETSNESVKVLYQKMGSRWYSFFVINEEVFMGEVPEEAINQMRGHDKNPTRSK